MDALTYDLVTKGMKKLVRRLVNEFITNPSASNYAQLERAMQVYQNHIKNTERKEA